VGLIPSRYPGSEEAEDSSYRMGRKTDWQDSGNNLIMGIGQRMLATDQGEYPLLEIREVFLNHSDRQPEEKPLHG
jgi:type VI secretion system protein ImpE